MPPHNVCVHSGLIRIWTGEIAGSTVDGWIQQLQRYTWLHLKMNFRWIFYTACLKQEIFSKECGDNNTFPWTFPTQHVSSPVYDPCKWGWWWLLHMKWKGDILSASRHKDLFGELQWPAIQAAGSSRGDWLNGLKQNVQSTYCVLFWWWSN